MYHEYLKEQITEIYHESHDIYGAPKIHYILNHQGDHASLKLVQKIMRELGLRSKTVRKWRPGPTARQKLEQLPNLINQDFSTTSLNQKWVTDITYIYTTLDGWCYLSFIQDLHSKKIIAHSLSKTMTVDLCLQTLKTACETQKITTGELILHSDMGSQYTSNVFNKALEQLGIKHSYSRKGCPYDNATIESFHASLKKEEVYLHTYKNFESAKITLFQYIEGFYNNHRIHSSLNYLTPNMFEQQLSA